MSRLSVLVENDPSVVVANPVYFLGELDFRKGSKLIFEVPAADGQFYPAESQQVRTILGSL
jgi:hypothetical protein